ncbi:Gag-Pol polyprotein [Labeo rohita]|uniref:Gag-Pol polyprotein n=1 Tax=Labeo rohita TaxID=84645 RepID=A0ABQ8LPM3_LABRO|nr:Gag-Pol polyprotein [Labeo rohita]
MSGHPARGLWSSRHLTWHINCLEMLALAHQILVWSQDKLLSLRAVHVPGHLSMGADILSRQGLRPGEWMLHPEVVKQIWRVFGQAQVDLFATQENAQCPHWFSLTHPAPLGLDAMVQTWPRLRLYAFPLITLLPGVLERVCWDGDRLLLVAQYWPARAWFSDLIPSSTALPGRFPSGGISSRKREAPSFTLARSCGNHQQDPVNCPVGTVLEFLQDRFSAGLAHSTLKVYVAAIAVYHTLLGGPSVAFSDAARVPEGENIYVDGSCSKPFDGVYLCGYAVVSETGETIEAYALDYNSAQAAELVVLIRACKLMEGKRLTEAVQLPAEVAIVKVKGHAAGDDVGNRKADETAKQAAKAQIKLLFDIDVHKTAKLILDLSYVCEVDQFSKWPEAFPCAKEDVKTVVKILTKKIIPIFGIPTTIESDNGTPFASRVMQFLAKSLSIDWHFSIPYHPQSCSNVERLNKTIKGQLTKAVLETGKKWVDLLSAVLTEIRMTPSSTTKLSPFEILMEKPTHPFVPGQSVLIKSLKPTRIGEPKYLGPATVITVTRTGVLTDYQPQWIHASRGGGKTLIKLRKELPLIVRWGLSEARSLVAHCAKQC